MNRTSASPGSHILNANSLMGHTRSGLCVQQNGGSHGVSRHTGRDGLIPGVQSRSRGGILRASHCSGRFPGVVVIHHFPGWDEWTTEVARKFAHHGYAAIAPNLYFRLGDGASEEVVARARAAGGMPDDQVIGDVTGALEFLRAQRNSNGKVAVIGFCSGGRQAYLAACRIANIDASVDCWGGNVVVDDPSKLPSTQPVAPIDLTEGDPLSASWLVR